MRPTRLLPSTFVGRETEIELASAALEAALAGQGQTVLLVGEPGIGKTRLAEELAARAESRGAGVAWGKCYEGAGAPAFWPWVQLLRSYLRVRPPELWLAAMGAGAADIALLIPELRDHLPQAPPESSLADDQGRFRLFESITHFWIRAARHQPLVIVLDDLHWADTPSLRLLQFLAGEISDSPLLVIGTYRDVEVSRDHPLRRTVAELSRARAQPPLLITGLSRAEVARLVALVTGEAPPAALVEDLLQQTAGNPFFVTELMHLRRRRAEDPAARIPPGVRGAIRLRLERLSPACGPVLEAAAVIGRDFSLAALLRLGLTAPEQLRPALAEAANARLITAEAGDQYRFVHALVRETLYDELPAARRMRLHQQVGGMLAALHAADPDPHLAELAYHFSQAAPDQVDQALHYTVLAADRATRLLAHEEAARGYASALQLLDQRLPDDARQRGELWLALGQAHARGGETGPARAAFERAAEVARRAHLPIQLAQAALGQAGSVVTPGRVDDHTLTLLAEALAALGGADPALRVRLLSRLAMEYLYSPLRDRREALSREALELARRLHDHATLAFALNARHFAILGPDTLEQRLAVSIEIAQLAEASGDRELALQSFPWRMADLLDLGHVSAADSLIETAARQADALRYPLYRWYVAVFRAMRALMSGRLAEGEGLVQAAHHLGQRVQPGAAHVYFVSQKFILHWERGRLPEADEAFRLILKDYPGMPIFRAMRVLLLLQAGQAAPAQAELEALAAPDAPPLPQDQLWLATVALLAEASAELGHRPTAARLYEVLSPHAQRNIMAGVTFGLGAAAAYLAQLATVLGRWEDAARHFELALALNTRLGARAWLARTQYHYGAMLLARGQRADRARAAELLAQAAATADELGLRVTAERAGRLRARVPSVARPYPDGLTAREAQVLSAIAAGKSTKEIAAALVVSVPTVERHITHLYEKIGARSRADATAYALQHGLT